MTSSAAELRRSFRAVIDQSAIPMYLADESLVVQHCNYQLGDLLNCEVSAIVDEPLEGLIRRFADRVPEIRRERFLARQMELASDLKNRLSPRSYRVEYVDNRSLEGNYYDRFYRVTIHSEKIYADRNKPFTGYFSVYHVVECPDDVLDGPQFDLFISYASADSAIAAELHEELESNGLNCFMAEKETEVAADWQNQIHHALNNSKRLLLILTPRSGSRPWVLMEAGAAWALKLPLIPATSHIRVDELPDPIRRHQARPIETTAQRQSLVAEILNS